jgi:hypothetical protein
MKQNYRVISCLVGELEGKLNELGDEYVPLVVHVTSDIPPTWATVVCIKRPPQATMAMPLVVGRTGRVQ